MFYVHVKIAKKKKKNEKHQKMTQQLLHTPYAYCILKICLSAKYKLENSNLINRTTSLKVTETPVRLGHSETNS